MEMLDGAAVARILLRVAHAVAGGVWLGSGAFVIFALLPVRQLSPDATKFIRTAQSYFRRWWILSSGILLGSGVALMFDRLADGRGTAIYVLLLLIKVSAGVVALAASTGLVPPSSSPSLRGGQARLRTLRLSGRAVLALGALAYVLGVLLSVIYPPDPGAGWR